MNFATIAGLARAAFDSSGVQGFRSVIENAENEVAYPTGRSSRSRKCLRASL